MPISPYSGQIYSGYTVGRPYTGASTSSYLSGNVAPGYKISNSNSSSALRSNPISNPGFLSGNTAALKKTFSDAGVSGLSSDSSVSYHSSSDACRRFNGLRPSNSGTRRDLNDDDTDRGYNPSWRTSLGGIIENEKKPKNNVKSYLTKYGTYYYPPEEDAKRPKDIDASKINFSGKPTFSNTSGDIRGRDGDSSISRNRQVVRLTIKRDKDRKKKPVVVPENSVKSIAQKLFEKYTVSEKKHQEPPSYTVRQRKLATDSSRPDIPKIIDRPPNLPLAQKKSPVSSSSKSEKDGNEGDDELSDDESASQSSDKNAAPKCYLRATNAVAVKKELEDPSEVKDAIVAAILHPGIDIESDEEIKRLVAEDTDRESSSSTKKKRKSKKAKLDAWLLQRRKKSDAEIGGDMLVDKLKRYVKHQVSIKKESRKHISRKNSQEKTEQEERDNDTNTQKNIKPRERCQEERCIDTNTQNNNKPRERIIPIILQDDGLTYISGTLKKDVKKIYTQEDNNKSETNSNSTLECSIRSREGSERKDRDKSTSELTLLLSERGSTIKCEEESLSKSFEPVYQTTEGRDSEALPEPFQISFQVSGEHSITHPENKVPASSSFITDSVSDWKEESGKEFLSLDSNDFFGRKEKEKYVKTKDLLKNRKNKELIISDYKSELDDKEGKNRDEFQSKLDNSITDKSSSSVKKKNREIFYSEELKSDYTTSKEETRKEFKEGKIESMKPNAERETTFIHLEDDAKELSRRAGSGIFDIKDKRGNNSERKFDKADIRANHDGDEQYCLVKEIPINFASKVTKDENMIEKEDCKTQEEKNGNLILEESSLAKHSFAKSKTAFLQSLSAQNKGENAKDAETKKFHLKKSATTQNVKENTLGYQISPKAFNDAESLDNNCDQDLEIKPSLRQFLEQAKSDMNEDSLNENILKEKSELKLNKLSPTASKPQMSRWQSEDTTKKSELKLNKLSPTVSESRLSPLQSENTSTKSEIKLNKLSPTVSASWLSPWQPEDATKKSEPKLNKLSPTVSGTRLSPSLQSEDTTKKTELKLNKLSPTASEPQLSLWQSEDSTKKALKRPRQVAPLVPVTKAPANEILNMKNVLRRPMKPKEEPKEQPAVEGQVEEVRPIKKVWRKPPPSKDGTAGQLPSFELTKAISGLRKPGIKLSSSNSGNIRQIGAKFGEQKGISKTENIEDKGKGLEVQGSKSELKLGKKVESKPKIALESKSEQDPFKNTASGSNLEQKPEPTPEPKPEVIKSYLKNDPKTKPKIGPKFPLRKDGEINGRMSSENQLYCDEEVVSTLSPSQSADSAYGSSPSTPQPSGVHLLSKKISEEKNDSKEGVEDKEKDENSDNQNTETCEMCGTNCHKKCEKQMANLCGVNQKLLAEALSSVKKGSSTDGKDASKNTSTTSSSASKSASSVSSTETETTTTEDEETETDDTSDYDGPSEIRSPIQTRPKFKKYNIEDFNFIKVLGKGSFGKVMLAQQVNTENYFAVKCLKKDVVLEDNDVECCLIERKVLTLGTKHPYLCHLFCSFQTPSHLFFVMEYLTGGDLMFHIQRVGRFDEYRSCFYGAEIVSGLKFLHNKGIIYRDLKLDNILLDYEGHIRIADFGMCKLQIYLDRFADTFCGTPDYMAPEVIKGLHYNQCVDWWSFGVLLYEMMVGKSPFKGCDEDHLFWLICNEEPFYPRFLSREAQSLLKMLLDKDATRRIGPPYSANGDIKCHQFFKYIDWSKIDSKEMVTPYKPRLRHILDVQYFDRSFTKRNAAITPLDDSILETMDQTPFRDFSYTNPNITD